MTISSGLYASDGSFRATVVTGSSLSGIYGADGSVNIITSPGNTSVGAYHPSGAWYVTLQTSPVGSIRNVDGSLNVSQTTYQAGTQKITVVGGGFGPTPGAPFNVSIIQVI